jgi:hypothetical protein
VRHHGQHQADHDGRAAHPVDDVPAALASRHHLGVGAGEQEQREVRQEQEEGRRAAQVQVADEALGGCRVDRGGGQQRDPDGEHADQVAQPVVLGAVTVGQEEDAGPMIPTARRSPR